MGSKLALSLNAPGTMSIGVGRLTTNSTYPDRS